MGFEYSIVKQEGYTSIILSGRLIEKTEAQPLIKEFEDLVESGGTKFLMSIANLDYVNSTGLNLLIGMFTQARNHGGELVIGGISPKVKKLMLMTKLDSIFKIYNSEQEAAESLTA